MSAKHAVYGGHVETAAMHTNEAGQRLLNIFRVFYNSAKPGEDKKTPTMRLGLAAGTVGVRRIINFRTERPHRGLGCNPHGRIG